MKGDEHIVRRVADKTLSDEKKTEIEERSRAALRRALERSGSPHVQQLEEPETRRRIRKQMLTRHALRERGKLKEEDNFWTFSVRTANLDPTPTAILEQFPCGVISQLGDTAEKAREAYEAILHDQQLQGAAVSETPNDALMWLQKRQVKEFKSWLMYLMADDGDAQVYQKEYEWFIPWITHALLTEVPDKYEIEVDGFVERRVRSKPRKKDTRDCVPHFDSAILALVFEEVKKQLTDTHKKAYLSERFGSGSHLPGHRKLETREVSNPNWDLDFYEIHARAERTRAERIEAYKDKIQRGTWQKITDPEFLSGISAATPWCLAGYETAKHYLEPKEGREAAIWLFFDDNKNPGVALHAVQTYEGSGLYQIRELRGADDRQDLTNPRFIAALEEFLKVHSETFSNINTYKEQMHDARLLSDIELETRSGTFDSQPIERRSQMLRVLYEMDRRIKHFGMLGESKKAQELRQGRDVLKDAKVIFYDKKVAVRESEVTAETEIYVGAPFPDMFKKLKNAEKIFSSQKIDWTLIDKLNEARRVTLGPSSYDEVERKMKDVTLHGASEAEEDFIERMLSVTANMDFSKSLNIVIINSNILSVDITGLSQEESYDGIIKAANKLGLVPCPVNFLGRILASRDDPGIAAILRSSHITPVTKEPSKNQDSEDIFYPIPNIRENGSTEIALIVGKLFGNLAFVVE